MVLLFARASPRRLRHSLPRRSAVVTSSAVLRLYHSDNGVYGFRPDALSKPDDSGVGFDVWQNRLRNSRVWQLIDAHLRHGYKMADFNPLRPTSKYPIQVPQLSPSLYGLTDTDQIDTAGLLPVLPPEGGSCTVSQLVQQLRSAFCGHLSAQFCHVTSEEEREWVASRLLQLAAEQLDQSERVALAQLLVRSQLFDRFLAAKFATVKRYGGEGAESALAGFRTLFRLAAADSIDEVVIGMAHRGRLNLLACLLEYPVVQLMQKMRGMSEFPVGGPASGDVLSHINESRRLTFGDHDVLVTLLSNPSHLEAVNPMLMGYVRARQQSLSEGDYCFDDSDTTHSRLGSRTLPIQVHGDAAVCGQGVIQEVLTLSCLPHTRLGGSIHLVINNQLGYTAPRERARSSLHCTDIAAAVGAPVFRANGDCPESVVKACRLAFEYRQKFGRDVFVDVVCYRRWGHNEMDDPTFTNPAMYRNINTRVTVPDKYMNTVVADDLMTSQQNTQLQEDFYDFLNKALAKVDSHVVKVNELPGDRSCLRPVTDSVTQWDTGFDTQLLKVISHKSVQVPRQFEMHDTLQRTLVKQRCERVDKGTSLDWATCEIMAIGSLLLQGFHVRLCGQDVGRGTFSQRHAMLVDQATEQIHVPLNHLDQQQSSFLEVVNSALTEEAQLAFEYGVSVESARRLCIWEAQFGDFFNGAQIPIDTMLASGEVKWGYQSGLVLLLPHGLDGAGSEHSSCRLERFLQLSDSQEDRVDGDGVNLHIIHPSTPAQHFHALRRQMLRSFRRPLVVASAKMLLRSPQAVSSLQQMSPGSFFQPVIVDTEVPAKRVTRLVFCSGRHYYTLADHRRQLNRQNVALIRLEQLTPFPVQQLLEAKQMYPAAVEFLWSQEEHRNQGAWTFVEPRFRQLVATKLKYHGRPVSAVPATGTRSVHDIECTTIVQSPFN